MFRQHSFPKAISLHLIAVIFVIFNFSNIKIAGISNLIPLFDVMFVFYFAVLKSIFGNWFLFLLGIWSDGMNGNPLGGTSLCYILLVKFFLIANSKLLLKDSFNQIWQQFIGFCFCFLLLKLLILSIYNGAFLNPDSALIQLVLSSFVYVVMHKFFDYLSSKLLEDN